MSHDSHERCTPEPQHAGLRVLVANEPRSYRETISTVIAQLRPHLRILAAEPGELDRKILQWRPGLVVCSALSTAVERGAPAWIELYPDGDSQTLVSVNGERSTHPAMDFDTLLSILDRVEDLSKRPPAPLS